MRYQVIHNQTEVVSWFLSESIGKSLQECEEEIAALGLTYDKEELEQLRRDDALISLDPEPQTL
jgi:hypothetical protein